MNIEFPCPEGIQNMKPTKGGFYCSSCNRAVISDQQLDEKGESCVFSFTDIAPVPRQTIRSFALAAMLVFGAGLFSFSNAQVVGELEKVKTLMEVCPVKTTEIVVTVQRKHQQFVTADVWAVLPNGKEIQFEMNTIGVYYLTLPSFTKGKDVVVKVGRGGKEKEEVIRVLPNGGVIDLGYVFRGKSINRRFITVGCPNF